MIAVVGRRAIWVAMVGAVFVVGAGLTVAVGPSNEDSGRAVTIASGSAITALVEEQFSEPPGGFFTIYGIERPTPDDLEDLELPTVQDARLLDENTTPDSSETDEPSSSSSAATGLEALVGVPTLSFSSGDLTTYTIPSGSEISVESTLCAAVGRNVHMRSQITVEVGGSTDPALTVRCARNRVSILDSSQRRSPSSISTADWQLLWSAIRTRQPARFIVQDVKGRRTLTLAQGASAVLGPLADDDALALLAIDLHERGWAEIAPPSLIGFVSGTASKGVQILTVYPSDADAEAARASFEKALPTGDPVQAKPAAGGGASVSRSGRMLTLDCPNAELNALFALPGRFPTFYVPE